VEGQRRRPVGEDELRVDLDVISVYWFSCWGFGVELTARRPQYSRLIRHSIGALATLSAFLT
jgi:hypothetical protein